MGRIYDALLHAAQENNQAPAEMRQPLVEYLQQALPEMPKTMVTPAPPPESRMVLFQAPLGEEAENYRQLAARLLQWRSGTGLRIVLITSAIRGEGKTTTALNLAAALARCGEKTLLLEADGRCPQALLRLGLPPRPGLAEWLQKPVPIHEFIVRLGPSPLWLLPAGQHEWSLEQLNGCPWTEMLGSLAQGMQWLLLDAPPLLPVAESGLWVPHVDGVLLVARRGFSSKAALTAVWNRIDAEKRLGWIMNAALPPAHSYAYAKPMVLATAR